MGWTRSSRYAKYRGGKYEQATRGAHLPVVVSTHMEEESDLLLLQSAVTAIDEAASTVAAEVERARLDETTLARLSAVEAELSRSRLALEEILRKEMS